jgi:LacI family transcriptional regulator
MLAKAQGLIVQVFTPELRDMLRGLNVPVINVSHALADPLLPRIGVDEDEVGRLAAEHFLDAQFRHFAYMGRADAAGFTGRRGVNFVEHLRQAGHNCHQLESRRQKDKDPCEMLLDQLRALPKPIALFSPNDFRAYRASLACAQLGLRVPEDVAILGVDNDETVCNWSVPPLSSVPVPGIDIGYRAANMLLDWLAGHEPARETILLPPRPVVKRRSTDFVAVEDSELSKALQYIRDHAHEGIGVSDLLEQVHMARRTLHRRFRTVVGRSPYAEIQRVRMERAKAMLLDTQLSISEVASRCGFYSSEHLATLFRRATDTSPTAYRRKHQLQS